MLSSPMNLQSYFTEKFDNNNNNNYYNYCYYFYSGSFP